RRRQRALAEEILKEVRDANRGVEGVGGVRFEAEEVGEGAQANEAGHAAEEDACRDRRRGATRAVRRGYLRRHVTTLFTLRWGPTPSACRGSLNSLAAYFATTVRLVDVFVGGCCTERSAGSLHQ